MTLTDLIQCGFAGVVIATCALVYGFRRGRDYGWQAGYFEREAAERRKRDQLGRFKPLTQ